MYDKRVKISKNWRWVIALSITLFIVLLAQDIIREIIVFNRELDTLKTNLVNEMKDDLEEEVLFRVSEINDILDNTNESFESHMIEQLEPLEFSVERTLDLNESSSDNEKKEAIIETVQLYNVQDEKHCYSVMTKTGILIYDGETDTVVNQDINVIKDDMNRLYLLDLKVDAESSSTHSSVIYAFFGDNESLVQKGYAGTIIEDTDYIILTVGSLNTFQEHTLDAYYQSLKEYYSTKDRSIYVFGEDIVYLQKNTDFIGKKIDDIDDPLFITAFNKILDESEEVVNGFFDVTYYKNLIDGEIGERVTYINTIDELDIVVGYSADKSSFDPIISDFRQNNLVQNLSIIIPIYIVMFIIGVVVSKLIVSNILMSNQLFEEEENLYRVLSDITEDILLITDKKGQIVFSNKLGIKTIFKSGEIEPLNLDDIMLDEDGINVLVGVNQNYYIKSSVTEIMFGGKECDLIIVSDVTEKVTKERTLEKMTLNDDLTKLGNRRQMLKDYKEYVLPIIKENQKAHLAMIDLDNFKQANDVYGHSFGDDVLTSIGEIFNSLSDENVKVYRVGGDEFALISMRQSRNEVLQVLRKMKNKISTYNYGKEVNIGFSAGVVEISIKDQKRRLSDYYEKADELLYKAKQDGKDKIVI